jgi:hypothetical protein
MSSRPSMPTSGTRSRSMRGGRRGGFIRDRSGPYRLIQDHKGSPESHPDPSGGAPASLCVWEWVCPERLSRSRHYRSGGGAMVAPFIERR